MVVSDNTRGILYMNIAMATFTLNDTFMKLVTQTVPLAQAISVRGTITVVLLVILARIMGGLSFRVARRDGWLLGWRTLGELGGTILFLLALQHMPLANLSAILQSLPLAVTLGAALIMGEKVGWRRMTAILVGFCGVLLIVRPGTDGFDRWAVLALLSVACVVLRDLVTRRFSTSMPSVMIALYSAIGVTLMGYAGLAVEGWQTVTAREAIQLALAASMLICGYLFVVMAMRIGDVAIIAPFRYVSLLWAIAMGWVAFSAMPDGWTLIGAAIVVATGLYTYLREYQLQRRVAASDAVMTGVATADR